MASRLRKSVYCIIARSQFSSRTRVLLRKPPPGSKQGHWKRKKMRCFNRCCALLRDKTRKPGTGSTQSRLLFQIDPPADPPRHRFALSSTCRPPSTPTWLTTTPSPNPPLEPNPPRLSSLNSIVCLYYLFEPMHSTNLIYCRQTLERTHLLL